MIKLYDTYSIAEIEIVDAKGMAWERDFFEVDHLDTDTRLGAYIVHDVDSCIEEARDLVTCSGDYADCKPGNVMTYQLFDVVISLARATDVISVVGAS